MPAISKPLRSGKRGGLTSGGPCLKRPGGEIQMTPTMQDVYASETQLNVIKCLLPFRKVYLKKRAISRT